MSCNYYNVASINHSIGGTSHYQEGRAELIISCWLCWKKILIISWWLMIATAAEGVELQRGHDSCTAVHIIYGTFWLLGGGGSGHSHSGVDHYIVWRPYYQLAVSIYYFDTFIHLCHLSPIFVSFYFFTNFLSTTTLHTHTHTARRRGLLRSHWSHQKIYGGIICSQGCDQI